MTDKDFEDHIEIMDLRSRFAQAVATGDLAMYAPLKAQIAAKKHELADEIVQRKRRIESERVNNAMRNVAEVAPDAEKKILKAAGRVARGREALKLAEEAAGEADDLIGRLIVHAKRVHSCMTVAIAAEPDLADRMMDINMALSMVLDTRATRARVHGFRGGNPNWSDDLLNWKRFIPKPSEIRDEPKPAIEEEEEPEE
jgi:hypothetical protein